MVISAQQTKKQPKLLVRFFSYFSKGTNNFGLDSQYYPSQREVLALANHPGSINRAVLSEDTLSFAKTNVKIGWHKLLPGDTYFWL